MPRRPRKVPFVAKWKTATPGVKFGSWTVTWAGPTGFTCRCSCGNEKSFDSDTASNLLLGKSTCCAACRLQNVHQTCQARPLGKLIPNVKLRQAWIDRFHAMVSRCTTKSSLYYEGYGGRGIKVGPSLDTVEKYLCHIVTLPGWDQPWAVLDRIDNDRGYEVGNVRVVTHKQNMRNTRRNNWVEYNGERLCVTDFRNKYCPRYRSARAVSDKIRCGYSLERIIAEQDRCHGPRAKKIAS